jgi:hypothetical protein
MAEWRQLRASDIALILCKLHTISLTGEQRDVVPFYALKML